MQSPLFIKLNTIKYWVGRYLCTTVFQSLAIYAVSRVIPNIRIESLASIFLLVLVIQVSMQLAKKTIRYCARCTQYVFPTLNKYVNPIFIILLSVLTLIFQVDIANEYIGHVFSYQTLLENTALAAICSASVLAFQQCSMLYTKKHQ